jgi:hypothetical protein
MNQKKNLGLVWIALAAAAAIFASSLWQNWCPETRRLSFRNNYTLYTYPLIVLGLGTLLFLNGRLLRKDS